MRRRLPIVIALSCCFVGGLAPIRSAAAGSMGTARPCSGIVLLRVPLCSSQDLHIAHSASGYKVTVQRFESGWSVQVFSPADPREQENLLAPSGEWNGYASAAHWVLPDPSPSGWLSNRLLAVRSSPHKICLHLHAAKTVVAPADGRFPLGHARFASGTLVVSWLERRGA
jgi:hypothetical protein